MIKTFVFQRDDFTCQFKVSPDCERHEHLEVHHIKPKARGGRFEPINLITICQKCHDNIQPPGLAVRVP